MFLNRLEVHDFRNLESVDLELGPGLNLFVGDNGAGKTALLEAVHVLGKGRSFRTHRVRNLVRSGTTQLVVRGVVQGDTGQKHTLAMSKSLREGTRLKLDGDPQRQLSRIAAHLPLQLMLPDVADLVFGPPSERRQFLDWGLFHVKHAYHGWLRDYLRLLKQRNAWLRSGEAEKSPDVWAPAMSALAADIHRARHAYCQELGARLDQTVERLGMQLNLTLRYEPGWKAEDNGENLGNVMAECLPRDVKSGSTQYGPHRADFVVVSGDLQASQIISRGQGKVVSSALNVSQAEVLLAESGQRSVFLIDDLGAELDRKRSSRFFELLEQMGCQILATALETPSGLGDGAMFHVKHGAVNRE